MSTGWRRSGGGFPVDDNGLMRLGGRVRGPAARPGPQDRRARLPALRPHPVVGASSRQGRPGLGSGVRRALLGTVLPQVRARTPGRHQRYPGDQPRPSHDRQPRRGPRSAARCIDAEAHDRAHRSALRGPAAASVLARRHAWPEARRCGKAARDRAHRKRGMGIVLAIRLSAMTVQEPPTRV